MVIKNYINIIRCLLYIQAIIRNGQINAAAEQNGIKASNLSKMIKEFEKAANISLFERGNDGIHPSIKGTKLYHLTLELEQKLQNILDFLNEESNGPAKIKIYLPPNFEMARLADFQIENPNVIFSYIQSPEDADVAVTYTEPEAKNNLIIIKNTIGDQFCQQIWVSCKENLNPAINLAEFITAGLHL